MPDNSYVKLWLSYEAYFEPLSDAEVGRLARAMIQYKSSGAETKFSGNERFVWPAIRRDIDYANMSKAELSQTRRESGKLGGRPAAKANAFSEKQKKQMLFDESKKSYGKGKGEGKGEGEGEGKGNASCSLGSEQEASARGRAGEADAGSPAEESDFSVPDGWDDERIMAALSECIESGDSPPDWMRSWRSVNFSKWYEWRKAHGAV